RPLRGSEWWHVLPRRDRRHAAGAPDQDAARAPGRRDPPARRNAHAPGVGAHRGGDEQEPGTGGVPRPLPRGSVLPPERGAARAAAATAAAGRHPSPRPPLLRQGVRADVPAPPPPSPPEA